MKIEDALGLGISGAPNGALGKMVFSDANSVPTWQDPGFGEIMQPGLGGYFGSSGITATINSSTGLLTFANQRTNDIMWFKIASGAYVRGALSAMSSLTAIKPTTAGNFRYIAIDAVPPSNVDGACTLIINEASVDQTTAILAANNPTSPATGNMRIWDGIVQNSAGTFVLVAATGATARNIVPAATGRDRCPWAKGYFGQVAYSGVDIVQTSTTPVVLTQYQQRAEIQSNCVRLTWRCARMVSGAGGFDMSFLADGSGLENYLYRHAITDTAHLKVLILSNISAGSVLFNLNFTAVVAAQTNTINGPFGSEFTVEELPRQAARLNGTA